MPKLPPTPLPAEARPIAPLIGLATRAMDDGVPPGAMAAGERHAVALFEQAKRRRRLRRVGAGTLGLTFAAAAAAIVVVPTRGPIPERPLQIVATPDGLATGGYVGGGSRRRVTAFSDGSRVTYEPGARGRILSVGARGAQIAVEEGTAALAIRPRAGGAWAVHAGPFVVDVRGTTFAVTWTPGEERFSLDLHSGAVRVRGPLTAGLEMRAGQALRIALREGRVELREAGRAGAVAPEGLGTPAGASPSPAGPAPGPSAAVEAISRPRAPARPSPPAAKPPSDSRGPATWPRRLADGDFDGILADAERAGIADVLARAPRGALAALADAARYRRQPELARRALAAQVARHPGSVEAEQAVFFLGRVAEQEGAIEAALVEYDRYLARAPGGSYAAEALGRKLLLVERRWGAARARPVAEEYLARFPRGGYARAAGKLLGRP